MARRSGGYISEPQPKAPLELGVKFRIGQSDDALGLFGGFGPYDGGPAAGKREHREGTSGQEVLLGTPEVIALVFDGSDYGALFVGPAVHGYPGALANARVRAVGSYKQARSEAASI